MIIYKKILENMGKDKVKRIDMPRKMAFIRFTKRDCDLIIKDMKKAGLIRESGFGKYRTIRINMPKARKMLL